MRKRLEKLVRRSRSTQRNEREGSSRVESPGIQVQADGRQDSQPHLLESQPPFSASPSADRIPTPAQQIPAQTGNNSLGGSYQAGNQSHAIVGNKNNVSITYNQASLSAALKSIDNAAGAAFDDEEQKAEKCVPGTREQLLKDIKAWLEDPEKEVGFWLRGMAGTGKSTVARTVAEVLKEDFIVVSFFFKRGDGVRGHPGRFVTTILRQLLDNNELRQSGEIISKLLSTYETNGTALNKGIQRQWQTFVQDPLKSRDHKTILLVIDAIDESEEPMSLEHPMFDFLTNEENFKSLKIRIFATSRPQGEKMNKEMLKLFVLDKIDAKVVLEDIRLCLKYKFERFNAPINPESSFPTDYHVDQLAKRACPLFIAAMTSFKFITEDRYDLESQFNILMSQTKGLNVNDDPERIYEELDKMYLVVIQQVIFGRKSSTRYQRLIQKDVANFQHLVGAVIILHEGLSYESLAWLTSIPLDTVKVFMKSLSAVLDAPEEKDAPVRVFHQSFPDFLKDQGRVEDACQGQELSSGDLWIDQQKTNTKLFIGCLEVMQGSSEASGPAKLKENICRLAGPGSQASEIASETLRTAIPPALRYACKYWVSHFVAGDAGERDVHQRLWDFLSQHLLHWIEAMSCLGNLNDAIRNLDQVDEILTSVDWKKKELCELVADCRRFIRFSKDGIGEAPLQIFKAALLFAPENCKVKRHFGQSLARWIRKRSEMDDNWSATLLEFVGHKGDVAEIKFSVDGGRIASFDDHDALIVWDAATGEPVWTVGDVGWLDVSSGGTLAFRDSRGNISVWRDMEKRNARVLADAACEGKRSGIVAFSADGTLLASVHGGGTLMVWDGNDDYRSQRLSLPEGVEAIRYYDIAFSSELNAGRFLAVTGRKQEDTDSGTAEKCIAVWRRRLASRWEFHHTFSIESEYRPQIALVGTSLICVRKQPDRLMIWDVESKEGLQDVAITVEGRQQLTHVPGTNCIVAPDENGSIRLYDLDQLKSGEADESQPLEFTDSQYVDRLSVSADGKLLAGAFWGGPDADEVGLWDTRTGERLGVSSIGALSLQHATRFSPDGKILAVIERDKVRLLDVSLLRQQNLNLKRPTDAGEKRRREVVDAPAVSPDGRFVAAATYSGYGSSTPMTVEIWDTETSEKMTLQCESKPTWPIRLTFSSRAKWLALATAEKLDIWHLEGTRQNSPLKSIDIEGKGYSETHVAFSTDGTLISFVNALQSQLGVLELDSNDDPTYHQVSCLEIHALSPFDTRNFCAVLTKNSLKEPREVMEIVRYGLAEPPRLIHGGDRQFPVDIPRAVTFSPTQQVIALRSDPVKLTISNLAAPVDWQTYNLLSFSASFGRNMNFCSQGRCLFTERYGKLYLPLDRSLDQQPCPCGTNLISRGRGGHWLFWQEKPFLWLPSLWSASANMNIGKGTVAYKTSGKMFWLKFDERLDQLLEKQPQDHFLVLRQSALESDTDSQDNDYSQDSGTDSEDSGGSQSPSHGL